MPTIQLVVPVGADQEFEDKSTSWIRSARQRTVDVVVPNQLQFASPFDLREALAWPASIDLLVADLAHERPSCYYELGLAQALGVPTVVLIESKTRLHQIADGTRVLRYQNMSEYADYVNSIVDAVAAGEIKEITTI